MSIEWAIIMVAVVADAILLAETSFRLEASPELRILAGSIGLAVVFLYCRWRRIPRLVHLARTGLALVLFSNAAELLSYILTGILPLPRWDEALATADRVLGLNWLEGTSKNIPLWCDDRRSSSQRGRSFNPWPFIEAA